ncbi:MAG: polyketide synthase, partial [Ilumatobacteraceae bacterium]|nr:polyketide synthase [Ilumatobacteraceae bacterium]
MVGIGCRLPGGVVDPTSMWQLLRDGVDAITPIPPDRFDVDTLYDPRPATPGRIMSRWGGFIDGIDGFDAGFFETAPREAERLDPQQRLLLETSWEALEDAGIAGDALAGSNTGVYVGMWINEYEALLFGDREHIDFHMTTG